MAGADTAKGAPSWVTEQGPPVRCTMMARRIGSDSAAKMSLRAAVSPVVATGRGAPLSCRAALTRVARPAPRNGMMPSRGGGALRLDDVPFQTCGDLEKLRLFARCHSDAVERRTDVRHEDIPFRLGDAETLVRDLHVAAGIIDRPFKGGADEVDQQLISAPRAVFSDAFPIHGEGGICAQPRHQIVHEGGNHIVTAEALVQRLLRVRATFRIEHLSPSQTLN